jgi:MFS family permease
LGRGQSLTSQPASGLWNLLVTQAATFLGDALLLTAFPLLAVHVTRSPALISTVGASATAPWLLASVPSGLLIDRRERRRLMAIASLIAAALASSLAIAVGSGSYDVLVLDGIAFFIGCSQVVIANTGSTLLPEVVGQGSLTGSNAKLFAAQGVTGQLCGPPLAGLLVTIDLNAPAVAAVICYAFATVALLTWRLNFWPGTSATHRPPIRKDLMSGLIALGKHRELRTLAAVTALLNLAVQAVLTVLVLYAVAPGPMGLSKGGYGLLLGTYALGAVLGTPLAAPLARKIGRARLLAIAFLADAVGLCLPALWPQPIFVGAAFTTIGIASSLYNVITVTFRQQVVPPDQLGRVTASYRLFGYGALPIGSAVGGLLATTLGVRTVFPIAAAIVCLAALGLLVVTERAMTTSEASANTAKPNPR